MTHHRRVIHRNVEGNVPVWMERNKMVQHRPERIEFSPSRRQRKETAPYVAICAFSQPALTTRYVMYVSWGELKNAAPMTRWPYMAITVHRSGA